ncbi:hypothetical protein N7530_010147 [Penicillium desertorum]|uniref:Uncharacterized protein n=1 Tax=Penicillium desertorum TaxID=1303715 RepID=A0A9X0BIR5_9EURO|nr:hypothetical protein N7530_010147 [Penicillium desertorum]
MVFVSSWGRALFFDRAFSGVENGAVSYSANGLGNSPECKAAPWICLHTTASGQNMQTAIE